MSSYLSDDHVDGLIVSMSGEYIDDVEEIGYTEVSDIGSGVNVWRVVRDEMTHLCEYFNAFVDFAEGQTGS